ncbi:hypothetical protein pdam_00001774 [Pocillopora damicornis]|uniref:Sodium/potassium-transporting ATPase subunit beta n=1 Tax=Pocillopora damicornis TaxID=46731 RepID=A0A3M6TNE4_POCDA|nr:sodium/potassium-transporting ATPase subunit beta-like [Pocillopora damicornis]RMX42935.1 hypothetical protein pdam_00001774 [Pocillopora damicornis]
MAYAKQGQEGKTRIERFQQTARDFGHFLYNKDGENGEVQVMGRNGKSWAKITVFFLIFYGCLAGFFASMLAIFMTTVPAREEGPKMTRYLAGKQGLIPIPFYEIKNYKDVDSFVDQINKFLEPYKEALESDEYQNCTDAKRTKDSKPCNVDLSALGPCYDNSTEFKYGYDEEKPCIFMKMNRVFDWVPEPNDGLDYVQLACKFEEEGREDQLEIYPTDKPGFAANFYPYLSEENWLPPIAAIKVNSTQKAVLLCEANAKNIEKSETYRLNRGATGRVRIEIKQG